MSGPGQSWQLFLYETREETGSDGQRVVEVVTRIVHRAAADGIPIADVDIGAGTDFEHV